VVNFYTLYEECKLQNTLKRHWFHKKMAISLIKPLAQKLLDYPMLPPAMRSTIHSLIPELTSAIPAQVHEPLTARKRYRIRGSSHRNKTSFACRKCGYPVCKAEVGPDPDYRSRLRQDSAFFFRTRIRTRSQKFVKNRTRSHFSISAVAGVCGHVFGKNMGKLRLDR